MRYNIWVLGVDRHNIQQYCCYPRGDNRDPKGRDRKQKWDVASGRGDPAPSYKTNSGDRPQAILLVRERNLNRN